MEFDYTITTKKDFNSAVSTIRKEITKSGFHVLYVHDVQAALSEKGFKIEPLKIIEFCNAKSAYAVLQADVKIGLCLPCKINVYTKNEQTFISGMRPIILPQFFPEAQLDTLPEEIDKLIKIVTDNSK